MLVINKPPLDIPFTTSEWRRAKHSSGVFGRARNPHLKAARWASAHGRACVLQPDDTLATFDRTPMGNVDMKLYKPGTWRFA